MWLRYGAHSPGMWERMPGTSADSCGHVCSFNAPGGSFEPKLDTGNADSQVWRALDLGLC